MGTSARLFWVLAAFFYVVDIAYIVWSLLVSARPAASVPPEVEWAGAVALGLTGALFTLVAFYLSRVHKSQGGELPEDRVDARIDDGEAEQGHFSPWSWWPVTLASAAALVFLGIAIGAWISYIGVALFLIAIVGWVYEYYRGYFAR